MCSRATATAKEINREKLQASNYHMFSQIIQIDYKTTIYLQS